ncbi:uncharacterized protein Z518_07992 [Rhinocladiella mackenziei CBS 650.93]|uniref:Uncharacterized protein n=1 Tax=Rhinocladiella mackenziei CBS 650.93 TaxID=1442369 RepID=A0A0D2GUW5_9EURO|nr:uncharacterized protein Z518_07992 [Rhinocladiella mackenziei CBS 650.93]KIX02053.1 hypothetical protein Z518_07992 [Rhinocladiella mackenziei CBS 650.93]
MNSCIDSCKWRSSSPIQICTIRLWMEVPVEETVFQDAYNLRSTNGSPPPFKEDKLCQAVGNLYTLLKDANPQPRLERLEVAFTRLDSWDRQGNYPRFLPVTLRPSLPVASVGAQGTGFSG